MRRIVLVWVVFLAMLGGGPVTVTAQLTQGTDDGSSTGFPNPANWTETIYPTTIYGSTITFELNPCEWVVYMDEAGRPMSCLPRDADCDTLGDMETTLRQALDEWDDLDPDALTFVINQPVTCEPGCDTGDPSNWTDVWEDDNDWTITRTYYVPGTLDEDDCPDADTGALDGGAGLRLYDDPTSDQTTRWVRECDLLFFEDKWDNLVDDCDDEFSTLQCAGAWRMALAHELGHCLGIGHSYLTRKVLGPLIDDLQSEITLAKALPSIMSYDRVGTVEVGENGLNPYDKAVYLSTYSDGPDSDVYFTAYGTVGDNTCGSLDLKFGVGVFALEEFDDNGTTKWRAVQMSISGMDPLGDGEFQLKHLDRNEEYRLLVADLRNANHTVPNGWDFDDNPPPLASPGLNAFLTDEWSETNSGDSYKYEMSGQFHTGFNYELFDEFTEPATGDYDAGCLSLNYTP